MLASNSTAGTVEGTLDASLRIGAASDSLEEFATTGLGHEQLRPA